MEQNFRVSIVVPVYNQEEYLDASVASLIGQSYQNLQIVLVNDGSTDASPQMLRRYALQDPRITLVEKENGGLVDATLAGIAASEGEYVCFLDPDDLIGKDFVSTFMAHMTDACDFVAAGYYTENKGVLTPYPLKEDRLFSAEELRGYADSFLYEQGESGISHRFFVARWNKLYRAELVKAVAEKFSRFRHISLGEDTLFTFLMLQHSRGGRTLRQPNSYYYNVGNANSMMKTGQAEATLKKAAAAFEALKGLTVSSCTATTQAYALYGFLVDTLLHRVRAGDRRQWRELRRRLRADEDYQKAVALMTKRRSAIGSLKCTIRRALPYWLLLSLKKSVAWARSQKRHVAFWCKECRKKGPVRATRLLGFQKDRENAYSEMNALLPKLEKRICPILKPYLSQVTDPDKSPLEKNVFVFWWDGFEKAPPVVQCCLESIRRHHSDCRIIPIDKDNFEEYTDIDRRILQAFARDKISVQTFSDILRFNLLKNNGGVWIDATILFPAECNLLKDLENKPFTTLAFSTSADFLQYGDERCTWSGFFIASRKGSLFVRAVDQVFQQYFLKYGSYSTYFFIDITMMLCKKYRLDGDALGKTLSTNRSMFALAALLNEPYNANVIDFIGTTPQKLRWDVRGTSADGTFYGWLLSQYTRK